MPRRLSRQQGHPHPDGGRPRRKIRHFFFPRVEEREFDRLHAGWRYRRYQTIRTHRDGPLTPRARALWWLVSGLILTVGLAVIIYSAR